MQTDIKKLREHNHEFFAWVVGDPIRGVPNISQGVLMRLAEMVEVACKDLELAEAIIHDLKEDKGLTQQVFRRDYTTQDVIAILEVAEEPMSFQDIIQALLRGGIYPENTFIINDAFRELNKSRLLSEEIPIDSWRHGKVMVGSPAWKKLPKSQQKLAKW